MLKLILAVVLAAHGIGHILFLVPLVGIADWGQTTTSWLLTNGTTAQIVGGLLWIIAILAFAAAALGLYGMSDWWRGMTVFASVVSLIGLILFFVNPPTAPVIAAIVVDALVLLAVLVFQWPTETALQ